MDNASISILIAGSVLIVILVIALAMVASTRAGQVTDTANNQFEQMSVSMHNSQFRKCEGTNLSYKEIKEVIAQIAQNNYSVNTKEEGYKVLLTVGYYANAFNESQKTISYKTDVDATYFVDNVNESTTKSVYLSNSDYTSRTYDCFAIVDTVKARSNSGVAEQLKLMLREGNVVSDGKGVINEIIIVARENY